MKTYHICTKDTVKGRWHLFCPREGAHYIDLPNGDILICCTFDSEHTEVHWNQVPGVDTLPHPVYEGTEPIHARHHLKLKHLGVKNTHTILDVARIAGTISPAMRLIRYSRP